MQEEKKHSEKYVVNFYHMSALCVPCFATAKFGGDEYYQFRLNFSFMDIFYWMNLPQLEFVQRMFEWNMLESFWNCLLKSDKDGTSEANLEIANIWIEHD